MHKLTWPQYFMDIAEAVARKSKDPETKVGTVIIDQDNHIIATGFNGMPAGMPEDESLWQRPTKYGYVIHSEMNAICHATKSLKDSTLFTTMFPCQECAKLIAASKIKHVYFKDSKYDNEVTRDIFRRCDITLQKLVG